MKKKGLNIVETVLIAVILALVVKILLLQTYHIESDSMIPSLHPDDRAMGLGRIISTASASSDKGMKPYSGKVRRGDVLVFKSPVTGHEDYVKRVIGLPGERVVIRSNSVMIDGSTLRESYAFFDPLVAYGGDWMEMKVEPGYYFVMGDNRRHSSDSRSWGTVSFSNIESRVFAVIWPIRHIRFFP